MKAETKASKVERLERGINEQRASRQIKKIMKIVKTKERAPAKNPHNEANTITANKIKNAGKR